MLKNFLPLFAMTFFIVLFIVLMQFLWKYIDDLVGKGLSMRVIGELFFYAALSMVPMALPLAILLASLMTFGNLGEKFELTAMKASGISLVRVMKPLIITVAIIAVGAFFFQNDVLPKAQVKMWTLLFSARQKSPELEIPEGVFYDQIPGYNLFVKEKDRDRGMLREVMIYNVSKGSDNASVITADSAMMTMTPDMRYLYLHLWNGDQFENLRDQSAQTSRNIPFRREVFDEKEVLIPFDANFNRMDEEGMRRQYVGKNINELRFTMDSVSRRIDSIGRIYSRDIAATSFPLVNPERLDKVKTVCMDTLLAALSPSERSEIYASALNLSERKKTELSFRAMTMADEKKTYRRHEIELIKKFTLSVACLIFFFIGAPLGAIIRKGGIGTPLVISVILFLIYYIIDNTGYKMARDGHITVWVGMWLSTFILAPLGIYVTYKAMNDSAVFDPDRYRAIFRHIFGTRQHRKVIAKEVIINDFSVRQASELLESLVSESARLLKETDSKPGYARYLEQGIGIRDIDIYIEDLENTIEYLTDCSDPVIVNRLTDYPVVRNLWIYCPFHSRALSLFCKIVFPVGIILWLYGLRCRRNLRNDILSIKTRSENILDTLKSSDVNAE